MRIGQHRGKKKKKSTQKERGRGETDPNHSTPVPHEKREVRKRHPDCPTGNRGGEKKRDSNNEAAGREKKEEKKKKGGKGKEK